jgi:membrane associated rhomboid family serine protease
MAEGIRSQAQARIDLLSNARANVGPSGPAIPDRPYRFTEDVRRALRVPPPATLVLFLLTVAIFIGQVLGDSSNWERAAGLIPANVAGASSLLQIGDTQLLPAWLTPFSYMFLHAGVFHLLANMACLWVFGILAEPVMGMKRFALTYLAFGAITGVAIVAIIPHWTGPMVGASGAISGALGAFLALRLSQRLGRRRQNVAVLLLEVIPALAMVVWFVTRNMPSGPDRASSAAWHVIPFLFAWYSVRIWKGLGGRACPAASPARPRD